MRRRTNGQPIAGALACNVHQFADIFVGQRVGDRGEQLRDLHQRPLDAAQRRLEVGRVPLAVDRHAQIALGPEPRPEPRHRRPDPRIAPGAAGKTVVVGHIT